MLYISFHGGSPGINNILGYDENNPSAPPLSVLLPDNSVSLEELRGFQLYNNQLFVVNAYKDYSQVLAYNSVGNDSYSFSGVLADPSINSIFHPYDISFDGNGNCYISNQDTNVVSVVNSSGTPLPVADWLQQTYPNGTFLDGTFVASTVGDLPHVAVQATDVPKPDGLEITESDDDSGSKKKEKVTHSVRGVLYYDDCLYVCDESASEVKVYNSTGQFLSHIKDHSVLGSPVQLLVNDGTLYISSPGTSNICTVDVSSGPPAKGAAVDVLVNGLATNASGICFDPNGNLLVADRKNRCVNSFNPTTGSFIAQVIGSLPDNPEFIACI
jgi:hypothetical protein